MRIGVLCPSEIAFRRFMPALMQTDFEYIGLAVNSPEERFGNPLPDESTVEEMLEIEKRKALSFVDAYGGKLFLSYDDLIHSEMIDAVYIPLPPGLHFMWSKKALEAGKHVFVEKPATVSLADTKELISFAKEKKLAFHENYMFNYHSQLDEIEEIIKSGSLGTVRLYSVKFGFPLRSGNDFRYIKSLGGGSLIDAGGYCIKYATRLLGGKPEVAYAQLSAESGFKVDMYGSGALRNRDGQVVQISFGMDNDYRCELEVWGSKGTLRTGRVLTAPVGFEPMLTISRNGVIEERKLSSDDAFKKSIETFRLCMESEKERDKNYQEIETQALLVEEFARKAGII